MSDWLPALSDFHFMRPWWFLGLVPALLALGLYQWRRRSAGNWEKIINPALLPFLMEGGGLNSRKSNWLLTGLGLAWAICCISLAGPTWQQLPQPVLKQDSAAILVFDLSPSMLAEDISPSRLVRARFKLIDILNSRREGFTALVVYGGEAHTVSPLTEDNNTIISLVPILHPTLLPEYGSNTEEAVAVAIELAANGGYEQADIILISDGVSPAAFGSIKTIIGQAGKYRLSILGVGTAEGAPIPLGSSGFVKDRSGSILIPKLDSASMQRLANSNAGIYRDISADDSDINDLLKVTEQGFTDATREVDRSFDLWDDQGFWLIVLLLPALILSFRKGSVVVILIAPLLSLSEPVTASIWQDLWQNPDQQGLEALDAGDAAAAQSLFEDSQWRGSAAYRAEDYASAIGEFIGQDSPDAHYNRGNALAKSGDLEGAIDAYNRALELQPEMEDALANRDLVEKLQQQQEQNKEKDVTVESQEDQEAREELVLFDEAVKNIPVEGWMLGGQPAAEIMPLARFVLVGEIEFKAGNHKKGLDALAQAVALENTLIYAEPAPWMMPARHAYGALLIVDGQHQEAEKVYQEADTQIETLNNKIEKQIFNVKSEKIKNLLNEKQEKFEKE